MFNCLVDLLRNFSRSKMSKKRILSLPSGLDSIITSKKVHAAGLDEEIFSPVYTLDTDSSTESAGIRQVDYENDSESDP